jgi:hypothetical protein
MSLFGGGGGGGKPKAHPIKPPDAPKRRDQKLIKAVNRKTAFASHGSSTLSNLLSAKADGVVGAAAPKSRTSQAMGV